MTLTTEQRMALYTKSQPENRVKTNTQFKVGDKVHIHPGVWTSSKYYIRATITELDEEEHGYFLRAFSQDCPGIHMFNIYDEDLIPRKGRARVKLPEDSVLMPRDK